MEFLETWGVIVLLLLLGGMLVWRIITRSNTATNKVSVTTSRQKQEADVNRLLGARGGNSAPSLTVISRSDPSDVALPDDGQLEAQVENILRQLPNN